jgi:hypothetical protein
MRAATFIDTQTAGIGGGPVTLSCPSSSFGMASDEHRPLKHLPGSLCPSTSFCVAADSNGSAFTYNGSTWSSAQTFDAGSSIAQR